SSKQGSPSSSHPAPGRGKPPYSYIALMPWPSPTRRAAPERWAASTASHRDASLLPGDREGKWQNSIRHNLTPERTASSRCRGEPGHPGIGSYWRWTRRPRTWFDNGSFLRRRKRFKRARPAPTYRLRRLRPSRAASVRRLQPAAPRARPSPAGLHIESLMGRRRAGLGATGAAPSPLLPDPRPEAKPAWGPGLTVTLLRSPPAAHLLFLNTGGNLTIEQLPKGSRLKPFLQWPVPGASEGMNRTNNPQVIHPPSPFPASGKQRLGTPSLPILANNHLMDQSSMNLT
uniref:Fork-head domain-containing protein n=1 Tax=Chelonoidis abingdonii TaxID=106734 RepID=A0A8C0GUY2_CHEAB